MLAAVLTGGASRRMGRPKAELVLDGSPMAVRVARAAREAGAARVAAVGRPVPGLEHLVEDHPGTGPLAAVVAALRWAGGEPVVVLGCDLVAPSPAAVRAVADALAAAPGAAVAVPVVGGRAQWLHAAWRSDPAAVAALAAAHAAGTRSLHGAAEGLVVHRVATDDEGPYRDADRPGDLPPGLLAEGDPDVPR